METNGRTYPLWSQFVERKSEFIGKVLEDHDLGMVMSTTITDVELVLNGDESAFFRVVGEHFSCGFDVNHGGLVGGDKGWITFSGYGGHTWRIQSWT